MTDPTIERRHPAARARALATLLDSALRIPGTPWRVGLDPLFGLIPGAGDLVGAALSGWVLVLAARAGASRGLLLRMLGNLAVDALLGAVPFLGDLFDAGYKANVRNVALLERLHDDPAQVERSSTAFLAMILLLLLLAVTAGVAGTVLVARWLITSLAGTP